MKHEELGRSSLLMMVEEPAEGMLIRTIWLAIPIPEDAPTSNVWWSRQYYIP